MRLTKIFKINDECDAAEEDEDILESLSGSCIFRPLYILSECSELETTTEQTTVAIVLSKGIEIGSFSVRIVEDGKCRLLVVQWSYLFIDLKIMHKKCLGQASGSGMYHPKISGLEDGLKRLRKKEI